MSVNYDYQGEWLHGFPLFHTIRTMGERPLECSGCNRKAKITYKEIVGKRIQILSCCDHCPVLKQKIHSEETSAFFTFQNTQEKANCPNCKLTYEEFVMGSLLGCSVCYEVFEESLIEELTSSDAIALSDPAQYMHKKKMSLHMGKSLKSKPIANADKTSNH